MHDGVKEIQKWGQGFDESEIHSDGQVQEDEFMDDAGSLSGFVDGGDPSAVGMKDSRYQ